MKNTKGKPSAILSVVLVLGLDSCSFFMTSVERAIDDASSGTKWQVRLEDGNVIDSIRHIEIQESIATIATAELEKLVPIDSIREVHVQKPSGFLVGFAVGSAVGVGIPLLTGPSASLGMLPLGLAAGFLADNGSTELLSFQGQSVAQRRGNLELLTHRAKPSSPTSEQFWFELGLGAGPFEQKWGRSIKQNIAVGAGFGHLVLCTTLFGESYLLTDKRPVESAWDIGLLYGTSVGSFVRLFIAAGPSITGTIKRGRLLEESSFSRNIFAPSKYEEIKSSYLGLSLEGSLELTRISRASKLVLSVHGNLNSRQSFYVICLGVQMGKFN